MKGSDGFPAGIPVYSYTSRKREEEIETRLVRDPAGRLDLYCRLTFRGEAESVLLTDLGRREEACVAFAETVAESHTHPRMLAELWEEFEA